METILTVLITVIGMISAFYSGFYFGYLKREDEPPPKIEIPISVPVLQSKKKDKTDKEDEGNSFFE